MGERLGGKLLPDRDGGGSTPMPKHGEGVPVHHREGDEEAGDGEVGREAGRGGGMYRERLQCARDLP